MRWDSPFQILTHYYTGVHIRDANGNIVTPDNRWSPLKVNWGSGVNPNNLQVGVTYQPQIQIQNTGIVAWDSSVKLGCVLKKPGGATVNCGEIAVGTVASGATVTKTLTLPVIGANWPKGVYDLRIDLKNANGWFRDQAIPWRSLNYKPCVGSNSCSENYLPLVMKNYVPPFIFNLPFNTSADLYYFAPHPGIPLPVSTNGTVNPTAILAAGQVSNDGYLTPNGAMKLSHIWVDGSGEGSADWTFDVQGRHGLLRAGDVDFSLSVRAGGGWGRDRSAIYVFFTDGTYVYSSWKPWETTGNWVQRWIKRGGEDGFDVTGNNPTGDGWGPYRDKYLDRIVLYLTFTNNESDFYIDDFELLYQPQ